MYLVWLDRELHIAINLLIQDTINPVNIFHFIQNQAYGILRVEEEYLTFAGRWNEPLFEADYLIFKF